MVSHGVLAIRKKRAEVWRPKEEIKLSDFCCRHIKLSPDWEAGRGRYNLDDNPFWREILDAQQDPYVREISIMKSTRVGGTLALIASILGLSELDPGPAMIVTPDDPSRIELCDRLYDTAAESRFFENRIPKKTKRNRRLVELETCHVFMSKSGSAQDLRGRTCRRVYRSEVDVYGTSLRGGGDPIKASGERIKRSFYTILYNESSPHGEMSTIANMHEKGNQMAWFCPCPHCGLFQELRFFVHTKGKYEGRGGIGGYLDEHGNLVTEDVARANGHYICLNGCRIENTKKRWMVCNGVWVPKGCKVNESGKVTGTPEKSRRHISCHLWSIHVPKVSFSELAQQYVSHRFDRKMRDWWQNWLGRRYRTGKKPPLWDHLGRTYAGYYERGQVPVEAYFLTAGVDVQLDGVYWSVFGWGHMSRCFLIDWGFFRRYLGSTDEVTDDAIDDLEFTNIGSDLDQLKQQLFGRRFKTFANQDTPHGRKHMGILGTAIDSGYRPNPVHRLVHQLGDPRVIAVKGVDEIAKGTSDRFAPSVIEKVTDKGKKQKRKLWRVRSSFYKTDIYDRFHAKPFSDESITFPRNMSQIGQDWLRQATNERFAEVENPKTNKITMQWVEESNTIGSHALDTLVYAWARADIRLEQIGANWDSNLWLKKRELVEPEQQVAREYQLAT